MGLYLVPDTLMVYGFQISGKPIVNNAEVFSPSPLPPTFNGLIFIISNMRINATQHRKKHLSISLPLPEPMTTKP